MSSWLYRLLGFPDAGEIARAGTWELHRVGGPPVWVLLALGALALVFAALPFLPGQGLRMRTRFISCTLRLAGFALILLALGQTELRAIIERHVKPRIAVLMDDSGSMAAKDVAGASRASAAIAFGQSIEKALGRDAEVINYRFAARLQSGSASNTPEGTTHLIAALDELRQREPTLDHVVLLSDGRDTGGIRFTSIAPIFTARGIRIWPVLFGGADQMPQPSLSLVANDYCRLDEQITIEATIRSSDATERIIRADLFVDDKEEPIQSNEGVRIGAGATQTLGFLVKPERAGAITYRVRVVGLGSGPDAVLNARRTVEVVPRRIRVLYLDIPRPERKFVGFWLSRDAVVEMATLTALPSGGWYAQGTLQHENSDQGLPVRQSEMYRYDVMILGDVPRSAFAAGGGQESQKLQWLSEFVTRRGGGLVTLGGGSAYGAGGYGETPLAQILPFSLDLPPESDPQIKGKFRMMVTELGRTHPIFQLEPHPEANRQALLDLPMLDGCNRVGSVKPIASLLAVRHEGEKRHPLACLQNAGKGKVLSLTVDTTWRWEMTRAPDETDYFVRFWGNVVRYLAPDPRIQPREPQVLRRQSHTPVGSTVSLSTRLVDEVYNPIRNAAVTVKVTGPTGQITHIYPNDGRDQPGLYEYDIALTERGSWKVDVTFEDKTVRATIDAEPDARELDDLRAEPQELTRIAAATGARMLNPAEHEELVGELRPSRRSTVKTATTPLWNLPWIPVLFILLVGLDCYLRKREGMV
jgi:uncharacterized membrane protein